jgi:bacterioferritin
MPQDNPLSSIADIRERARRHLESGALTDEYKADRAQVIKILNELLATELVCVLRYKSHYYNAAGIHADAVKPEFLQHAREAQQHADLIANRIVELNGAPDFSPRDLAARSHSEFKSHPDVIEMIREDLIAERIAIESYSEVVRWLKEDDITTAKLMKDILAVEEQHALDMKRLIARRGLERTIAPPAHSRS